MTAIEQPPGRRGAVVVTGASTGIGEACALHLAGLGFEVFATVRSDADGARLQQAGGGRVTALRLEVTDPASIEAAAGTVAAATADAGIAGLVNNAGVAVAGPLEFLPVDELRRQLEVNVLGQVAVTQAFLPALRSARGRIVNMGSISGRVAIPLLGAYAASKFALEALTDALRRELAPWGIHVAVVEPGLIATPIWAKGREHADALLEQAGAEAERLYGGMVGALRRRAAQGAGGLEPQAVATVVEHALTAARPRTRYVVGREAKLRAALARVLPDRAFDRVIARSMGTGGFGSR